jgi:hypothetical protein
MGLKGRITAGGRRESLTIIIPMIKGTYSHNVSAVTCKILNEGIIRNVKV